MEFCNRTQGGKACTGNQEEDCGGHFKSLVYRTVQPPIGLVPCDDENALILTPNIDTFTLNGPITGEMMRVPARVPQVVIKTNDVTAFCKHTQNCKFLYNRDLTPLVESILPPQGIQGDIVTVTFDGEIWREEWVNQTSVQLGGVECIVIRRTVNSVDCAVGPTPAGSHKVNAHIVGVGNAYSEVFFQSILRIDQVIPANGSLIGGTILVIEGKGFATSGTDNLIRVGDAECRPRIIDNTHCAGLKYEGFVNCNVESVYGYSSPMARHFALQFDFSNYERVECVIEAGPYNESVVDVSVTVNSESQSMANAYAFLESRTPIIYSANPNPAGRSVPITLNGENLEADEVIDTQYYMNIWGFYERFPNVSVFLDDIDVATKKYDRQIFGKNLCFIGDVTTEDRFGKHQQWNETNGTQITCTVGDIPEAVYPVHVYIHGKGFARVQAALTVGVLIESIEPSRGSLHGGELLTIRGSGFARFNSHNQVKIGKNNCTITSSSATEIVCKVKGVGGKEIVSENVTVSVACGNIAICNSEPQESNSDVHYVFTPLLTPTVQLVDPRRTYLCYVITPMSNPNSQLFFS